MIPDFYLPRFIFSIFLILASINASAQTVVTDNTQIDSLRFVETRKNLNELPTDRYTTGSFSHASIEMPYRLLLPETQIKGTKYPLVITLHNSSRIGTDNNAQLEHLAKIWLRQDIRDQYPCFVLAPQFSKRSSEYIQNDTGYLISSPSEEVAVLNELIRRIIKENPNVDKKRIYLIGYSMGGSTVQNLLRYNGKMIAAVVSIAGVPDMQATTYLNKLPTWLIHGKMDTENPFRGSEMLYKKLQQNKNLSFTEFTNLNHGNIVIPFLLDNRIPDWLFSQHK